MGKKILIGVLILLLVIQLFGIDKNESDDQARALSTRYHVPEGVSKIMAKACYDCHSNKTIYPWYSQFQPIAWWLDNHIKEGKRELNLSAFTHLPIAVQNHKLEEIAETVEENEMPLESYTWFGAHPEANLSKEEKEALINWAHHQMDSLKGVYPPDSLKMKRRG